MSLFRSSVLAVGIEPGRLGIARLKGFAGSTVVDEKEVAISDAGHDPAAHVDALSHWLVQSNIRKPTVSIVLSDAFVRFAVVPPVRGEQFLSMDELSALAHSRLSNLYGDMEGWACSIGTPDYGQAILVCAIQQRWIDALRRISKSNSVQIATIKPAFTTAWDRHCKTIKGENVFFAVRHSESLTVGLLCNGKNDPGWISVRMLKVGAQADAEAALLEREMLILGTDSSVPRFVVSTMSGGGPKDPQLHVVDASHGRRYSPAVSLALMGMST